MSYISRKKEKSIWDEICKEFALMRPPFQADDEGSSVTTEVIDYNPAAHSPVMFGHMYEKVEQADTDLTSEFNPAVSHPAAVGYTMIEKPLRQPTPPPAPKPPKDTCTPREYQEHYIFPTLLPALLAMLKQAKIERCFERKRFRFNGLDFLTEYLWRHNPSVSGREKDNLDEIPFVKTILAENPRPPLPLSLIWSEVEAATVIQSFFRGYKVRKLEHIQELRHWQKEWREENADIKHKVEHFWMEHEPGPAQEELRRSAKHNRSQGYPACFRLRTWSPSPEPVDPSPPELEVDPSEADRTTTTAGDQLSRTNATERTGSVVSTVPSTTVSSTKRTIVS
ncbi:IQ domain-containing protein K [Strongylocentrotus purpuratus]|uniref:IQ domain-containing protein K n=1 Tax=Strongylocentrotus purpuratus TaxID=7668 RepID=A0A7M7R9S5_STRPU|nr:IQ domain-containing protein K [Strongylocentrotus purpuratus]